MFKFGENDNDQNFNLKYYFAGENDKEYLCNLLKVRQFIPASYYNINYLWEYWWQTCF